jgi:DNA-binding CsgD family transcriptional regulator/KaiC/GvpD/RAD55 family RecA-like ATPase
MVSTGWLLERTLWIGLSPSNLMSRIVGTMARTPVATRDGWTALTERDAEYRVIDAALERAQAGRGCVALLYGTAGLGRTSLLRACAVDAARRGFTVLEASASEFERAYGFGVARQLLEDRTAALSKAERAALTGSARQAVESALGLGDPAAADAEAEFWQIQALHRLVTGLAATAPVAVVVDDLQWCDRRSLDFLCFLGHRAGRSAVTVVAAWRRGEPGGRAGRLQALAGKPETLFLTLAPLSLDGVREVLVRALGTRPDEATVNAVHRRTGGQPRLAAQLAQALRRRGGPPSAEQLDAITPEATRHDVVARLGRHQEPARALAHAVAILVDAPLAQAGALAGLAVDRARAAAGALVRSGLLADDSTLAYVQPLVRDAVYGTLSSLERAELHGRAAALLCEADADHDRVAWHLLRSEPAGDPRFADALSAAAARAGDRGSDSEARTLMERALRELADPGALPTALTRLAGLDLRTGRTALAREHAEEALASAVTADERAAAVLILAEALAATDGSPSALDLLDGEAGTLEADGSDLATELRTAAAIVRACTDAPWTPSTTTEDDSPGALAARAVRLAQTGDGPATEAAALCDRVLGATTGPAASYLAGLAAIAADRPDLVERALAPEADGGVADVVVRGALRAQLALSCGELAVAEAEARGALELVARPAPVPLVRRVRVDLLAALVRIAIERGRAGEADQTLDLLAGAEGAGGRVTAVLRLALAARGAGRPAIPGDDDPDRLAGCLSAGLRWRAEAALAHHADGDADRAVALADRLLADARAWGTATAHGVALLVRGVVGPGRDRVSDLERAVSVLQGTPARLDLARATIELGSGLRRAGRRTDARRRLEQGADLAHRCGADALSARAREELVALGARPRRTAFSGVAALTASELRVARLAAEGLTNREIAQRVIVSVKTVAGQLTSVYRKLDVHDRVALASMLAGAAEIPRES